MSITSRLKIAGSLATVLVATKATAEQVPLSEKPGHVTEATVVVDAPPSQVYSVVTDYAHWRQLFSDLESVKVLSGGREDATVQFLSRTLQHQVTVRFDNVPDREIRFRGVEGPPGGRASGDYVLTPLDGGKRTQITARLYMDIVGPVGWLVRGSKVQAIRRAKLESDISDVVRRFPAATPDRRP